MIRCTILGSGTSVPVTGRAPPGLLVAGGGATVLVDPGPGACHRAGGAGADLRTLDAVCVSHLHLDHVNDLGVLFFALHNPALARTKPLLVAGGPGLGRYRDGLERLHGRWVAPEGHARTVVEDAPWRLAVGGLAIEARPTDHIPGAVAFRFETPVGASLVYSGDTTGDDGLVALSAGADCLVMECSASDAAPIPKHSTPRDVIRVVRAARVRRVVLTHFYPELPDPAAAAAQVADATGVPCEAAVDGMVVELAAAGG
jgi:ribonuclease BN (tRNA processing enzyme)